MLPDGSWELDFHGVNINDLTPLRGQRMSRLGLGNTTVTDLTLLRGVPLTFLMLYNTKVADLSPLAGIPLVNLVISGTGVTDISALRGMSLSGIRMHNCTKLTDLSPSPGSRISSSLRYRRTRRISDSRATLRSSPN